jgi:hypothetical protein
MRTESVKKMDKKFPSPVSATRTDLKDPKPMPFPEKTQAPSAMSPSLAKYVERRGGPAKAAESLSRDANARSKSMGDSQHATEAGTVVAAHMDAATVHRAAGNEAKATEHEAAAGKANEHYKKLTGNPHPRAPGVGDDRARDEHGRFAAK